MMRAITFQLIKLFFVWSLILAGAPANAALVGRSEVSPGSGVYLGYYDHQLDITWAANADMQSVWWTWESANEWAAGIVLQTTGGMISVDGWRLPSMDVDGDGVIVDCAYPGVSQANCMDNELGHCDS